MSEGMPDSNGLHLPDLTIKGFRGIQDLTVSRLGRVTLFVGANGSGKTTLLDAVRVYASRADPSVLSSILRRSDEFTSYQHDDDSQISNPDWPALVHGRQAQADVKFSIGPTNEFEQLQIMFSSQQTTQQSLVNDIPDYDETSFTITGRWKSREMPVYPSRSRFGTRFDNNGRELPADIPCNSLGPGLPNNSNIAGLWDKVALTDDEQRAVNALNLILDAGIERVAIVGYHSGNARRPYVSRRAIAKIKGASQPVPLRSLGDGAVRLFSVALALANSRDGFLLIDEVENGIHYKAQVPFWKMVLKTARENNVQVFATTHGWDCVAGYAIAKKETEDADAILVRLESRHGWTRAVEYPDDDLWVVAEQGIEVR